MKDSSLMRINPAAALFAVLVCATFCGAASADDFGRDDSGSFKFTMTSLPFFGDDREEDGTSAARQSSAYDDAEYTTDSIGRRVPVRTHRSGSAISSH